MKNDKNIQKIVNEALEAQDKKQAQAQAAQANRNQAWTALVALLATLISVGKDMAAVLVTTGVLTVLLVAVIVFGRR